jgi:hypothetical protein
MYANKERERGRKTSQKQAKTKTNKQTRKKLVLQHTYRNTRTKEKTALHTKKKLFFFILLDVTQ